jgi:hypothetical protein
MELLSAELGTGSLPTMAMRCARCVADRAIVPRCEGGDALATAGEMPALLSVASLAAGLLRLSLLGLTQVLLKSGIVRHFFQGFLEQVNRSWVEAFLVIGPT